MRCSGSGSCPPTCRRDQREHVVLIRGVQVPELPGAVLVERPAVVLGVGQRVVALAVERYVVALLVLAVLRLVVFPYILAVELVEELCDLYRSFTAFA